MMMSRDKSIIPALMFHSVGLESHPWVWSYISEPLALFESKIASMQKAGYRGVFWQDLYDHMSGRRELPSNSILLTFDDGYLDNWVNVFPILKKYGMKATIFVSPDFVDPSSALRPSLDDVDAGRCDRSDLQTAGFLNWEEMRVMEDSGLIDIQSHAMTHTWYFSGPNIVGFHEPREVTLHPWLHWNERPGRKPFYLSEDQQEFTAWGYPIFEHQKSLIATRFFPDESIVESLTRFVADNGGAVFFERPDSVEILKARVHELTGGSPVSGRYEDENERTERITRELADSKAIIGKTLDKEVDFICWPGGANDETVRNIASRVGFKSWTLSSSSQAGKRNRPGVDPTSIKRIGTSNILRVKGRTCGTGGAYYQYLRIAAHQRSIRHAALLKAYKLTALARSLAGIA